MEAIRPLYRARCVQSNGWWAVDIADAEGVHLKGGNTQVQRLDQVEAHVREVVAVLLDVDEDSLNVRLEPELLRELGEVTTKALRLREDAARTRKEAAEAMRLAVDAVIRRGLTYRDAGLLLGLSHQRVAQILSKIPRQDRT